MRLLRTKMLCLVFLLFTVGALLAQPQTVSSTAHVSFERRWPAADPQWFELVIQPDGSAKYRSLPHPQATDPADDPAPEPYEFSFTISPAARQQIFSAAPGFPRFQDSLDKTKVAFTGTKTLKYQDETGKSAVLTYNFSSSPELSSLTELFQGISESIEMLEKLKFQLRFDKLSLDATLRNVDELVSIQRLPEPQILEPVLQRIANDPTVMNIARQRARRILQKRK